MTSTPRRDEVEDMDFDLVFNQPHLTPVKETKLENKRIIRGKMPMPLKLPKAPSRTKISNYDDYLKMIDIKNKKEGGKKRKSRKIKKSKKYSKKKRSKRTKRRKTKSRRR